MKWDDINDLFLEAQNIPRHSLWVWKLDTFQLKNFFDRVVEETQKEKKAAVLKAVAKERKACAAIVAPCCKDCAKEILARGKK